MQLINLIHKRTLNPDRTYIYIPFSAFLKWIHALLGSANAKENYGMTTINGLKILLA